LLARNHHAVESQHHEKRSVFQPCFKRFSAILVFAMAVQNRRKRQNGRFSALCCVRRMNDAAFRITRYSQTSTKAVHYRQSQFHTRFPLQSTTAIIAN